MLQAIRDKAQGWIAWAIVILISIPFALWGIQEYLGVGGERDVAVVDGEEITQRMLDLRARDFREGLRLSLGDNYRADMFEDRELKEQVRDAMIAEFVLVNHARDWNLRASDDQTRLYIASIPAFQRDGQFDQQAYEIAVRNRGITRAAFEESVRQEMAINQLRSGISDTVFVTDTAVQTRVRLGEQQRMISYARIPATPYREQIVVDPEALRAFYDASLDRYRTPERVKLDYLVLDTTALKGFIEVGDEALRDYFESHRSEFVARQERAMRHILVSVSAGADEATEQAAEEKATALLRRIRDGEDFAALAQENSDDPGSATSGGDLGWVERGLMVAPFEEAAFALEKGEVSELVRTDFGFHIIEVTDIRGGAEADFESVRDEVDAAYRKFESESLYFDYAERMAESAYENSASLTPAAEALGLTIRTSAWLTRDSMPVGVLGSPRVVAAAFSDDVLIEGHNSELVEVGAQQAVVVRIAEHEPAGVRSFDDHLAMIEEDFKQDRASVAAAEAGADAISKLADGAYLDQLVSDAGWALEKDRLVGRNQTGVPAEVVAQAFAVKPPAAGAKAHTGVVSAEGDYFVIEISEVRGGDLGALADAAGEVLRQQAGQQLASAQMRKLTDSLRERTAVKLLPIPE